MSKLKLFLVPLIVLLTACSGGFANLPTLSPSATPTLTPSPVPPTSTAVPLALTVNGEGISRLEYEAEISRYKSALVVSGKTATDAEIKKTVQDDLVAQLLLAEGAREAGFTLSEADLTKRIDDLVTSLGGAEKLSSWETAHGYTDASFRSALQRASAAAWMRDKIMAAVPTKAEQVHVQQILLYNEDVAKNYYSQLQAGADFDTLAAQVDPDTRGDIGWFPRNYLAEKNVEDAAFSLQINAYSEIISGEVGFHILKLLDRQPDRELSPDALAVYQKKAIADWISTQRQKSDIVLEN